ncbi:hypothetical protein CLAIMM_03667 [Cladophialophora immunda]|nr:hypothetical protein CLAIMM_03667 [Cladophialophora immunda]
MVRTPSFSVLQPLYLRYLRSPGDSTGTTCRISFLVGCADLILKVYSSNLCILVRDTSEDQCYYIVQSAVGVVNVVQNSMAPSSGRLSHVHGDRRTMSLQKLVRV